jgi:hypothetical protein
LYPSRAACRPTPARRGASRILPARRSVPDWRRTYPCSRRPTPQSAAGSWVCPAWWSCHPVRGRSTSPRWSRRPAVGVAHLRSATPLRCWGSTKRGARPPGRPPSRLLSSLSPALPHGPLACPRGPRGAPLGQSGCARGWRTEGNDVLEAQQLAVSLPGGLQEGYPLTGNRVLDDISCLSHGTLLCVLEPSPPTKCDAFKHPVQHQDGLSFQSLVR